ncbi:MAG: outer membrane protein assembly factor BamD [Gammaproteobacteria bacterium]|nr:outer membrane protein assembly factor BamD [Gammaproteobacteria bacterium]MCB1925723.1 outer membrane protein assembly factor BamD [Gammaproteobacteria bacterium]
MLRFHWLILLAALALTGCSAFKDKDETKDWSQQKLYAEATDALWAADYPLAIKYYEILESRYPFGKYAHQSQINLAYAYYRYSEHESALAAADRFIKLHPRHPATAYAYYLRGLINFNRNLGFLDRFLPTDTSQRDPGAALDSYKDFSEVIRQFPDSEYAEDAARRMLYLRNNLARFEVHVARYYLRRGAYLAAANRAEYVVQNYQRTPALRDALDVMIDAYGRLGMTDLQDDARRVLALNESSGALIPDPQKIEDKPLGLKVWEFFELDVN